MNRRTPIPVSGLVLTLSDTPEVAERALAMLRRDRRIELGERRGPRQPVVLDTVDGEEDRQLWEWLHEHEGILKVDVVFVYFDEERCAQTDGPASGMVMPTSECQCARQSQSTTGEV